MIGVPYAALTGEYGLAWQVLSWGITVPVLLIGLWAWLVLLDRRFGWGLTSPPPGPAPVTPSDELFARNGNHRAAQNGQEAPYGASPDGMRPLASWMPHPDDPLPAEAILIPEEEEEPALALAEGKPALALPAALVLRALPAALVLRALPPATPQPVSTEAQTRPRPRRRRRRLRG